MKLRGKQHQFFPHSDISSTKFIDFTRISRYFLLSTTQLRYEPN